MLSDSNFHCSVHVTNDHGSIVNIDLGVQVNFSEQANSQIQNPQVMRTVCTYILQGFKITQRP